jgi:hypothetical protein
MEQRIQRSKQVMWNVVDNEAVLLNTETGFYYGMNKTASVIWELLETPKTIEEIVQEMNKRFSVDSAVLTGDVEQIIKTLTSKRLIEHSQV